MSFAAIKQRFMEYLAIYAEWKKIKHFSDFFSKFLVFAEFLAILILGWSHFFIFLELFTS